MKVQRDQKDDWQRKAGQPKQGGKHRSHFESLAAWQPSIPDLVPRARSTARGEPQRENTSAYARAREDALRTIDDCRDVRLEQY
jgi:hypothetical protein